MRLVSSFASELLGPEGAAQFAWSPSGDMLAVAGARRKKVALFDRQGALLTSLTVPDPANEFLYDEAAETPVASLAWHPAGGHLAVLPRGQSFAMVWSPGGGTARVESGVKAEEVTALAWNPAAPQLALGTAKGGGLIYDCSSGSALPLALGRAAKPVCCAAWSAAAAPGGLLALGCKGGLLLLCRVADGGLARSVQLKAAVSQLQFCEPEADGAGSDGGQALLAANVGKRSVCVWQLPRALAADSSSSSPRAGAAATGAGAPPFELCFREGYGELEHFCWCSPRLLAAGFSTGQLVAVSLSGGLQPGSAAGTERFSALCLQGGVAALAWCPASGTLAAGAGCQLALLSCQGQEVALLAEAESLDLEAGQRLAGLHFCGAGTHLTAACTGGRLLHLLVRPPLLHGAWGGQVAYVDAGACPTEALLVAADQPWPAAPVALPLLVEPDLLALGPGQLAAAQGSTVWLQGMHPDPATGLLPPPVQAEFPADIRWLGLSAACLLLLGEGGRVFVQPQGGAGDVVELTGDDGEAFAASCATLTENFILLGLPDGTLAFYAAADCQLASQFQHGAGIAAAFPSTDGTLVLFQDAEGGVFLYNAVQGQLMPAPEWGGGLTAAVWDGADPRLVAAVNDTGTVHAYLHIPTSVQGPGLKLVGTQAGPCASAAPLALHDGTLTWHLPSGGLHAHTLATHTHLADAAPATSRSASRSCSGKWRAQAQADAAAAAGLTKEERLAARCRQALALCRFDAAVGAARQLGDAALLREAAAAALQFLELPAAAAAYEAAGDEEALAQLRPLLGEADAALVAGQVIAMTGGDADRAEELLLGSSRASAAVEMRQGLGHWERAIELAGHLQPHALGGLALLRAQALEAEGQAEAALVAYEQAQAAPDLTVSSGAPGAEAKRALCAAGLARCCVQLGDFERGAELAAAAGAPALLLQCAELLEAAQQAKQAGQLYARAGEYERAARLFLACREFGALDGVMAHAGSPALWLQYAQAKEDLGSFADAARAYEQAGDVAAAVRVLLHRLRDAEAAAEVAQRACSADARLEVARWCEGAGKPQLAMEQYCLAGDRQAGFLAAKRAGCVPAFAAWARQARDAPAALLAAEHFEAQGAPAVAAELCALAGQHERAARLFIQAGGDSLPAAVKLAGESRDPAAAAVVLAHLQAVDGMGAALQELHLALGDAEQACAVAGARAQAEQAAGNYKAARDLLLRACRDLAASGAAPTPALLARLHLVHCYLLVRTMVRQGDHAAAARLLLVVAEGIAAFPKHAAAILTSTVIECHRAALAGPAQRWAAVLMQPQYAGQVAPAYSKKVEALARQPAWTAERAAAEEPQCDCLFCGAPGPEAALTCAACKRALPFCAVSGRRMALSDWSACPSCNFPCRGRDLTRFASVERCCPLCEAPVAVHDMKKVFDPVSHMRGGPFADLVAGSGRR